MQLAGLSQSELVAALSREAAAVRREVALQIPPLHAAAAWRAYVCRTAPAVSDVASLR